MITKENNFNYCLHERWHWNSPKSGVSLLFIFPFKVVQLGSPGRNWCCPAIFHSDVLQIRVVQRRMVVGFQELAEIQATPWVEITAAIPEPICTSCPSSFYAPSSCWISLWLSLWTILTILLGIPPFWALIILRSSFASGLNMIRLQRML